jgi:hypothetical protein
MISEVPVYDPDQLPDSVEAEPPDTQIESRVSLAPGLSLAIHGSRNGGRYVANLYSKEV